MITMLLITIEKSMFEDSFTQISLKVGSVSLKEG